MKNIMHLEDLAFFEYPGEILEIVSALIHTILQDNKSKALTVKYDGAPLVVFGNEDGFFVSNKSYLNKTSLRYRTMDEINSANVHEDVKDKLAAVYHEYADAPIVDGMVYFADFLFSNYWHPRDGGPPITNEFQPNIIKYKLKRGSLEHSTLGLAFHTRRFCGQDLDHHFPFNLNVWTPPIFPDIVESFDKISTFDDLNGIRNSLLEIQLTNSDTLPLRKHLNVLARECSCYTRASLEYYDSLPLLAENIDILNRIKYRILSHLNKGNHATKMFDLNINDHPTTHEGYVFKYNNYLLKLVDRYAFSKANFSKETSRGWQKSTAN